MSFKSILGLARLVFINFQVSLLTIFYASRNKLTREKANAILQNWAHRLLKAARVDWHVHSPSSSIELISNQSYMLMCNHSSHFDIPLSIVAFPGLNVRMMAKKELFRIPFFGKAMRSAEFAIIDRGNIRQGIQDLKQVEVLMQNGIVMWIAPEGTRSKTGEIGNFKRGGFITAIQAKAMIIPIGIVGSGNILPAKSLNLNFGQRVDIYVGEPIDAGVYTLEQKDELIQKVKGVIEKLLQEKSEEN